MTADDPLRYGRLRLDGSLDEFHHAINRLAADTCQRGRCDTGGQCGKHTRRARERHLRAVPNPQEEAS
jgi:hypothetical protein